MYHCPNCEGEALVHRGRVVAGLRIVCISCDQEIAYYEPLHSDEVRIAKSWCASCAHSNPKEHS